MLLCIAALPLLGETIEHWWEQNINKLKVALFCGVPTAIAATYYGSWSKVLHLFIEYWQFVILLGSLYVVSGGISIKVDKKATPWVNAAFLLVGTALASFIGTTGAAVLLIRPLIQTNKQRKIKAHTIIFYIFCVANCGGLLTPLGDPPLFMGYLRGVPFLWTFGLIPMWIYVNALIIIVYLAFDMAMYSRETRSDIHKDNAEREKLKIAGAFVNLPLLFGIVCCIGFNFPSPYREIGMLLIAGLSWLFTPGKKRKPGITWRLKAGSIREKDNEFSFHPILEVAALFIGIFLAMVPALITVEGIAPSLTLNEHTLFVYTGGLSGLLDNAPTYITFHKMAMLVPGSPRIGTAPGVPEYLLVSISLAAVFCGALTYIGNGPNFMIKAIADESGIKMPSFFGYMAYSCLLLLPILSVMYLIFIAKIALIGYILTGGIVAASALVFIIFYAKAKKKGLMDA